MPVIITPGHIASAAWPMSHARIGYHNLTREASAWATSQMPDHPADAVTRPDTYERWRPSALPASLTIDLGSAQEIDYIGIAAHALAGCALTVAVAVEDGAYETIEQVEVSDNSAIMLLIPVTTARYLRLSVVGSGPTPSIGVVYAGRVLEMQRPIYGGHTPGTLARETDILGNRSEAGQFLGRSIIRRGHSTSYQWEHLTATWYRANFDPFVESARQYPFFVAWRPASFPSDVIYGWATGDIHPANMGIRDLMSVSMGVEGHA